MPDTITVQEQTIGFEGDIAIYDERGWSHAPLCLNRMGDTSDPLVVNVKISNTLNDDAPGTQVPLYHHAIEMYWKAGETGRKEVPIRIKQGSVQTKPLYLVAALEIPPGQNVQMDRGCGHIALKIESQYTAKYPDKSAEYLPLKRTGLLETAVSPEKTVDISITPFIPPSQ